MNERIQTLPDKHNPQRRKLLRKLAAGSVAATVAKSLPETWTRPIVDSVILPAHAQSSGIQLAAQITIGRRDV